MFSILFIWFVSNYNCLWCLLAYLFHPQKDMVLPLMLCHLPNLLLPVLVIIYLHLYPSVINVIEH